MLPSVFGFCLVLGLVQHSDAWGSDGHMITGKVASALLTAEELTWVKGILSGQDLADVATWADTVKFSKAYAWSRELHFINTPDGKCSFDWDRDCRDASGVEGNCVGGAILNYTQRMLNARAAVDFAAVRGKTSCEGLHKSDCTANDACEWDWTGSWKTSCKPRSGPSPGPSPGPTPSPGPSPRPDLSAKNVALRFLTHFMGDIHQPLHDGWTTDKGGNTIHIEEGFENDKKFNLHQVWDEGIIQKAEEDNGDKWDGYAANLVKELQGPWADKSKTWASCLNSAQPDVKECLTQIAQESLQFDCDDAYKDDHGKLITSGEELDETYYETRKQIIDERLAQGGVRLAALLKYIMHAKSDSLSMILV